MANQFNSKTNANIQALVTAVTNAVGNGFQVDFSFTPGFELKLQVTDDGQKLIITGKAGGGSAAPFTAGGGPNNPFYAPDSGPGVPNPSTHLTTGPAFVVDGNNVVG